MGLPPSSLRLFSPQTGTEYHITVASPDPATQPGPWRVVVVLDADDHFDAALDGYRGLWARGQGRPLLLVGVGYGAGYKKPGNHRLRDYTVRVMDTDPGSGGGHAFHDFLTQTLWPRLVATYPIDEYGPTLLGHSLGGLFVLHAMFRPEPFFARGVAAAPSLWWDERATLDDIAARHAASPLLPGRLYVGVGEADTESMQTDIARLEELLHDRPFAELRIRTEHFPGRGHFNVVPVAYASGLTAMV